MRNFLKNFAELELRVLSLFTASIPVDVDPLQTTINQTMAADVFFNNAESPTEIDLGIAMKNHAQANLTALVQAAKAQRGLPLNTPTVNGLTTRGSKVT